MSLHGLVFQTAFPFYTPQNSVCTGNRALKGSTHWQCMMCVKRPTSIVSYVSPLTGGILVRVNTNEYTTVQFPSVNTWCQSSSKASWYFKFAPRISTCRLLWSICLSCVCAMWRCWCILHCSLGLSLTHKSLRFSDSTEEHSNTKNFQKRQKFWTVTNAGGILWEKSLTGQHGCLPKLTIVQTCAAALLKLLECRPPLLPL